MLIFFRRRAHGRWNDYHGCECRECVVSGGGVCGDYDCGEDGCEFFFFRFPSTSVRGERDGKGGRRGEEVRWVVDGGEGRGGWGVVG